MSAAPTLSAEVLRALEALPDPYAVLAPDETFTILTASDAYLTALPTTRAALQGRPVFAVFPEHPSPWATGAENLLASLRQASATGQPHQMPLQRYDLPAARGGFVEKYFEILNTPVLTPAGAVHYLLHKAVDVTAQVQAYAYTEAHLEAQDRQLQQLLTQVPAAVATLQGPEHRYTFMNPRYQTLVGGRAAVGQCVADALPGLAAQGFIDLLDTVFATGESYYGHETRVELRATATTPAREIFVNFTYQALRDGHQHITGILVFAVDATEQVRARRQNEQLQAAAWQSAQQLLSQREALYQLFEQTPALICILRGPEHRLEYCNRSFQQLYAGRDLVGRPVAETQPEAVAQVFVALLDEIYASNKPVYRAEVLGRVQNPEGLFEDRYFHFTYQTYQEQGVTAGVSVFAFEVTGQVRLRQQAEAAAQDARQQRAIGKAVLATQQQERRRIAESLHNGTGQLLSATRLQVDRATRHPEAIAGVAQLLSQAIESVRTLSAELMSGALEAGTAPADPLLPAPTAADPLAPGGA